MPLGRIESGCAARAPAPTGRTTPVIHRDSSLARNTADQATSQAVPSVPSAFALRRISRWDSDRLPDRDACRWPGAMQLTRMFSLPS